MLYALFRTIRNCLATAALALLWGAAFCQEYPNRPIRVIVPFPAGGATDAVARTVTAKLTDALGRQFVIDNRPGAGGSLGTELAAKAPPDGYTLLFAFDTHAVNPHVYKKLPFDTIRDFAPISLLVRGPHVLVASAKMPVKTVQEFVKLAKGKPGEITCGHPGVGSSNHLTAELFSSAAGVRITQIPYKGGAPAMTELLGGHIDVGFLSLAFGLSHIKDGKLTALAVTSRKRVAVLPQVPTFSESGFPGFESQSWVGMLAPAATPKQIVARLHTETVKVLAQSELHERLTSQGWEVLASTPEQFGAWITSESDKWGKVIRDAKISLD